MRDGHSMNPAIGYAGLARIVRGAEGWVARSAPSLLGYSEEAVGHRLLQRTVEMALSGFLKDCAARAERVQSPLPLPGDRFEAGGLRFDTVSGHISPTLACWVRSMLDFAIQWFRVLAVVTRSALTSSRIYRPGATLVLGIGVDDLLGPGSDSRFIDFCKRGAIKPLREARRLIVECIREARSTDPEYCRYAKYPVFQLLDEYAPKGRTWCRFAWSHIATGIRFIVASIRHPLTAVLARDAAVHALVTHLNRSDAIECIAFTNSHYHAQPLWMRDLPGRRFTSHMIWYSQNSFPFVFKRDAIRSYLPNHRYIQADEIWVWTAGFAEYLASQGARGRSHVVGPILWYLPEQAPSLTSRNSRKAIVVFDVTPFSPHFTAKLGVTYNYYSASTVRAFVADIVAARDALAAAGRPRMPIVLKHKRTHSAWHDASYIRFVEDASQSGAIELVDASTSIYSLVRSAAVVVVIPFSSPAYVAAEAGTPAIYYDPAEELLPSHEPSHYVSFVSGRNSLEAALAQAACVRPSASAPQS